MKIVQREHGWLSPTAMEQAACVLRLTPAYLISVASFYDMFELRAQGRDRRLRVHEHLVLAARRRRASTRAMKDVLGRRPGLQRARASSASARARSRRWPRSTASTSAR